MKRPLADALRDATLRAGLKELQEPRIVDVGEPEQSERQLAGMLALRAALFAVLHLDLVAPAPSPERFAAELLGELDRACFRVAKK